MIAPDYLKRIAAWSRELNEREIEVAAPASSRSPTRANEHHLHARRPFEYWTGIVTGPRADGHGVARRQGHEFRRPHRGGLVRRGLACSRTSRAATTWSHCAIPVALMDRSTFFWLFENSVGFNRFLVRQLNERLGQFIGATGV